MALVVSLESAMAVEQSQCFRYCSFVSFSGAKGKEENDRHKGASLVAGMLCNTITQGYPTFSVHSTHSHKDTTFSWRNLDTGSGRNELRLEN